MSDAITETAPNSWRALPIFLVLAFALSWYPWALHAMGSGSGNPNPNPLGLLLAALIASSFDKGWRGPVAILASIVRVRAAPSLWLAAFGLPLLVLAVTLAVAATQNIVVAIKPPVWADLVERLIFILLFIGLGEEPAWRGFLQPMLQRQLAPLAATLCVAVIWAAWHAPLFGGEFSWDLVPVFLVSVPPAAVVLAWLYNASGGSSLLPMVTHTMVNIAGAGYVFTFVPAEHLLQFWWIYAAAWSAAAVIVIVFTLGRLGAAKTG